MALFKILQGLDIKLNDNENPIKLTEGYCYFTVDNHLFYIDHRDKNGTLKLDHRTKGEKYDKDIKNNADS